jgi:hypothetical protein
VIKYIFFIAWFVINCASVVGQKNDYNWLMGYESSSYFDTACQCGFGITRFDFDQNPRLITHDSLGISFDFTNNTVSDSAGNLLFYTNDVQIYNSMDELIANGDSLGWGPAYTLIDPALFAWGSVYCQQIISLPNPKAYGIYDLFYLYIDTLPVIEDVTCDKLLHARLDMTANSGLGAVLFKDQVILSQNIDATISATRHANGKDWWLCTNQTNNNCHDILLYTGDDSLSVSTQCSGFNSPLGDLHACRFSQDGAHYVTIDDSGQVSIFNFDRCAGTLTLQEEFIISDIADSGLGYYLPTGMEFSANSRFLYIFCSYRIFQYDLWADTIANSKYVVASWKYPGHSPADYYWAQLAPDGKIYISGSSGTYYLSVIDSADNPDSACNFLDQSMHIPTLIDGVPYNPNYRLGALTGSPCDTDTVSGLNEVARAAKERILKVFPNPAEDYTVVDYGFTDWSKGPVSLEICNSIGQTVYQQQLPMYSGYQKIDISPFASGMYMAFIKRGGGVVATAKFVKAGP